MILVENEETALFCAPQVYGSDLLENDWDLINGERVKKSLVCTTKTE